MKFYRLIEDTRFDKFILACIILNTIVLAIQWYNQPKIVSQVTSMINYIFAVIFAIEAVIKIIGYGIIYFKDGWNIFDFIVVLGSIVGVFL